MAIKKESGGKKPMGKMASKAKPRKVMVDPSSASGSINKAKKALKNSGGDYDTSRKADAYAKELKKIGIIINPAKDMYGYKPVSKPRTPRGR
jgi:hypothetical protein